MRSLTTRASSIHLLGAGIAILFMFAPSVVPGEGPPISSLISMVQQVRRDFASIHQFREVNLSGHPEGPTDVVVSGKRFRDHGWHVEVFRKASGQLIPRWESEQFTQGVEFSLLQVPRIRMRNYGRDYHVLIKGCAKDKCSDGVRGYL